MTDTGTCIPLVMSCCGKFVLLYNDLFCTATPPVTKDRSHNLSTLSSLLAQSFVLLQKFAKTEKVNEYTGFE